MRVFVTGARGFIGSAVVKELVNAGHEVVGLARSEESAKALIAMGARAHIGSLEDVESLRKGAAGANGAIHLAFFHKLSACEFLYAPSHSLRRKSERYCVKVYGRRSRCGETRH